METLNKFDELLADGNSRLKDGSSKLSASDKEKLGDAVKEMESWRDEHHDSASTEDIDEKFYSLESVIKALGSEASEDDDEEEDDEHDEVTQKKSPVSNSPPSSTRLTWTCFISCKNQRGDEYITFLYFEIVLCKSKPACRLI